MTAEELYKSVTGVNINHKDIKKAMIEFAKYHVEQALKYASEEAVTINYGQNISKDSILDAYPLDLIK